jgi:hypothetical protein
MKLYNHPLAPNPTIGLQVGAEHDLDDLSRD